MMVVIYLMLVFLIFYTGMLLWFIAGNMFSDTTLNFLDTPPVSVIIAIRNGENSLSSLIADLSAQDYSGKMEFQFQKKERALRLT